MMIALGCRQEQQLGGKKPWEHCSSNCWLRGGLCGGKATRRTEEWMVVVGVTRQALRESGGRVGCGIDTGLAGADMRSQWVQQAPEKSPMRFPARCTQITLAVKRGPAKPWHAAARPPRRGASGWGTLWIAAASMQEIVCRQTPELRTRAWRETQGAAREGRGSVDGKASTASKT